MDGSADSGAGPIAFRKMHGLGNDFVVIDQRTRSVLLAPDLVRAIGDRRRGVGFDQLAEIHECASADAELVFWNADGSTAAACGNATRCIADLLMSELGRNALSIKVAERLLSCARRSDGLVSVDMGVPLLAWQDVPLARAMDTERLEIEGSPAACSMGNPHCTFFADEVPGDPSRVLGVAAETDPLFPERTNVQLVEVMDRTHARVRVWERGVGMTLASGSSSCAVLVNAVRRGKMDRAAKLELDGGTIEIAWREDDHVLMTGPVASVFEGRLSEAFVAEHA